MKSSDGFKRESCRTVKDKNRKDKKEKNSWRIQHLKDEKKHLKKTEAIKNSKQCKEQT